MKTMIKLSVLTIAFMALASVVFAVTLIQSNILTITRTQYDLTITAPKTALSNNETLIITARYTNNGLPIANATIDLFKEGDASAIAENTTLADGTCQLTYADLAFGTFNVWAEAELP